MHKFILLTGGTGFVGSHVIEKILNKSKNIIILKRPNSNDWRITKTIEKFNNNKSSMKMVDIEKFDISNIFELYNIEGIVHLATSKKEEIKESINSNITFPASLLNIAVKHSVKWFINTGSVLEYPSGNIPINSLSKTMPSNIYSTSKISFEIFLKYYNKEFGINASTLKLFTPFGPKDNEINLIPYLIIQTIKNNKINIKNPYRKIDPIFINDVSNAYLKTINNIKKFKKYETLMIGGGHSYSINEIHEIIIDIIDMNPEVTFGSCDTKKYEANITETKKLINWKPEFTLEDGLNLTINYYREKYYNHLNLLK